MTLISYFGKLNSILGSVVPLAMFIALQSPLRTNKCETCRNNKLHIPKEACLCSHVFQLSTFMKLETRFLSISMAYNVISCRKVVENTPILKIDKFSI